MTDMNLYTASCDCRAQSLERLERLASSILRDAADAPFNSIRVKSAGTGRWSD